MFTMEDPPVHLRGDVSAVQSIRDLFDLRESSDVTLVCDGQIRIRAHRFILALHSPVLKSLLEDVRGDQSYISLPGASSTDLRVLLSLMYFRNIPDSQENSNSFLELIKRLKIEHTLDHLIIKQELDETVDQEPLENVEQTLPVDTKNPLEILDSIVENWENLNEDNEETESDTKNLESDDQSIDSSAKELIDYHNEIDEAAGRKYMMKARCNVCEKMCRNELMLTIHMEEHQEEIQRDHQGKLICNKCDKKCKTIYQLREHKIIHYQGLFTCDKCGSKFQNFHGLKFHLKHHDDHVQCDLCDKKFRGKYHMNEHKKAKHQGLLLKCNYCERGFSGSSNLGKHVRKEHMGIRYPCVECNYVAKQKSILKHHIDACHPTVDSVLHSCQICGRFQSFSKTKFRKHYNTCRKKNEIVKKPK